MEDWDTVQNCLTDAGCSAAAVHRAEGLYRAGATEDFVRCLRVCRANMLEELHEKQKQLDRLDALIYRSRKEQRNEQKAQQKA